MPSYKASLFTESVIREMTRLAVAHDAVNLAQGFPDFPAPAAIKHGITLEGVGFSYPGTEKDVLATDWFFKAHFFQDPVQPGSLGLEAMISLLQFHLIESGDGADPGAVCGGAH